MKLPLIDVRQVAQCLRHLRLALTPGELAAIRGSGLEILVRLHVTSPRATEGGDRKPQAGLPPLIKSIL